MTTDVDDDDTALLPTEDEIASTGAAAESAEWDEELKQLPRLLRYAVLARRNAPAPLRDRFRIATFPKPGPEHLDALLPPVVTDLAAERGLDSRWIEP